MDELLQRLPVMAKAIAEAILEKGVKVAAAFDTPTSSTTSSLSMLGLPHLKWSRL